MGKEENVKKVNIQAEILKRHNKPTNKKPLSDKIVAENMTLINNISANIFKSGILPPGMAFDDLVSYGVDGLIKAWDNFDTGKGIQFSVYASYRVRGEILDSIRREWRYRNPGAYQSNINTTEKVAKASNDLAQDSKGEAEEETVHKVITGSAIAYLLSFEEKNIDASDDSADFSERVINDIHFAEVKSMLWQEVQKLTEDERRFVKMFYVDNLSQQDISKELGFSKSKVSRMHSAVLMKLKDRLRRYVR